MSAEPITEVLVAGGGVAGVETLLALRDLAGDRLSLTLLTPDDEFVAPPMAVAERFSHGRRQRVPMADVARDAGARLLRGRLAHVDDPARGAVTEAGERLRFDALVVAVGARAHPALDAAITWGPDADPGALAGVLRDVENGSVRWIAVVIPIGPGWPLPGYELALMTAREAAARGRRAEVVLVTPEDEPLGIFGAPASAAVRDELERAGVLIETGAYAATFHGRVVRLEPAGRELVVDRVIAMPRLAGPQIGGLACDRDGFLLADTNGRVHAATRVWAAGDATAFPLKHGGLAAQQADAAAHAIAKLAGASVEQRPFRPVLRGMLLTGDGARWMHHDVAGGGGEGATATHTLWWPPTKIAGRYLAPYLAERAGESLTAATHRPSGLPVELDLQRELDMAQRAAGG